MRWHSAQLSNEELSKPVPTMTSDLSKVLDYVCVCVCVSLMEPSTRAPSIFNHEDHKLNCIRTLLLMWKERQTVHSNTGLSLCALNPSTLSFLEQLPYLSVACSNPPSQSGPSH